MILKSVSSVAPTIICVDCPAGANFGTFLKILRSSLYNTNSFFTKAIGFNISECDFSGARSFNPFSVGISKLTESRSAYKPASRMISSLAPGIDFK